MSTTSTDARSVTRRSPRFKVNFGILLFAVVQNRKCTLQGQSHDLSAEGMSVYIAAELQVGQLVQIQFVLPESQRKLGVTGIVRSSQGFRCSVEFQHLTAVEQEELAKCCLRLAAVELESVSQNGPRVTS